MTENFVHEIFELRVRLMIFKKPTRNLTVLIAAQQ